MRRSLLIRLLGLSLAVAVFSIAATAWLTTRSTSERLRGEFQRTLEADSFVYQELLFYAQEHESWKDVGPLVDGLAQRTGQRISLTTIEGDLLADSSTPPGGDAPPLPSTPTAEINALQPGIGVSGVATGGTARLWTASGSLLVKTPDWRLTPQEYSDRQALAEEATICMQQLDTGVEVVLDANGTAVIAETVPTPSPYTEATPTPTPPAELQGPTVPEQAMDCMPEELYAPSAAAMTVSSQEIRLTASCLDEEGALYKLATDEAGLPIVVPPGPYDQKIWDVCTERSRTEAIKPFLAEPAVLYTGSTDRFNAFSGDGWIRTALTGLAVLIAATGVTILAGRRLVHPIRTLTSAAQRMGAGERNARVTVGGHDEVAKLGHAFNAMAESIETNERQRKAMVSDIAHELRTPLANVRGYLEAAEDGVVPLDAALVTSLLEETTLLQRLIDDLQDLALADAGMLRTHRVDVDAAELAGQITAAHQANADKAGITLTVDAPEPLIVEADPVRLRQALGNLIANAVQYTQSGGNVHVTVRRQDDDILLSVEDDGPGIAAEHLPYLFDRFYRTETSRSRATGGSGLGLAIARHLVHAHDGTVDVASTEGIGSIFTIRLPVRVPSQA